MNNFKEYGFEADFEGEILSDIEGYYIGYYVESYPCIKEKQKIPTFWNKNTGNCYKGAGVSNSKFSLKPIKKEWYEELEEKEYGVEIKGGNSVKTDWLEDLKIKYVTGNYILLTPSALIRDTNKWIMVQKPLWDCDNYILIHIKHKDILEAYLKNPYIEIETGMFAPMTGEAEPSKWVKLEKDFIEDYNEEFWYRLKKQDLAWYEEKDKEMKKQYDEIEMCDKVVEHLKGKGIEVLSFEEDTVVQQHYRDEISPPFHTVDRSVSKIVYTTEKKPNCKFWTKFYYTPMGDEKTFNKNMENILKSIEHCSVLIGMPSRF